MKIRGCSFSFCSFVVLVFFLELISTEYFPGRAGRQSSMELQLQHGLQYKTIAWLVSHFINGFIRQMWNPNYFQLRDILQIQKIAVCRYCGVSAFQELLLFPGRVRERQLGTDL